MGETVLSDGHENEGWLQRAFELVLGLENEKKCSS